MAAGHAISTSLSNILCHEHSGHSNFEAMDDHKKICLQQILKEPSEYMQSYNKHNATDSRRYTYCT